MRVPKTAHTSRPWKIHELTHDFRLEDVWVLTAGRGRGDFRRIVELVAAGDPSRGPSLAARTLWAMRWKLGELLGWDDPDEGLGSRVPTLRDRLPADLRDAPSGPDFDVLPFSSLYLIDDEFAAEIANRTMHGVMHIGLIPAASGSYRVQMAVLVKPNGLLGTAYMAAIRPFRHLVVYPPMLRAIERRSSQSEIRTDAGGQHGEPRWTVLYDADCGFCTWLLSALLRWDRGARLRPIALQRPEAEVLLRTLTPAERMASWHLISPSGERRSAGAALPPLLRVLPGGRLPAAALTRFPRLTNRGYQWITDHRSHLSSWVPSSAKQRALLRVRRRERGNPC